MTTQPPLTAEALRQLADVATRAAGWRSNMSHDSSDALLMLSLACEAKAKEIESEAARLSSPAPSPAGGGGQCVVYVNDEPLDMTEAALLAKNSPTKEMFELCPGADWSKTIGAQIMARIPMYDPAYTLLLMHEDGTPDEVITSDSKLELKHGMRFWLVPPCHGA